MASRSGNGKGGDGSNGAGQGSLFAAAEPPPTLEQQAIYDQVISGQGNTVVLARAGAGKSTTIVKCCRLLAPQRALLLAFGVKDRERLAAKGLHNVDVQTTHSYGLSVLTAALGHGKLPVDDKKTRKFLERKLLERLRRENPRADEADLHVLLDEAATREVKSEWTRLAAGVSYAKAALAFEIDDIASVLDRHRYDLDLHPRQVEPFAQRVSLLLDELRKITDVIDRDDMIWLPVVLNVPTRRYHYVFLDEAQDLTPAQIELAMRSLDTDGRMCAVGDDSQAIYGWRGADRFAMHNIVERLNPTLLPLSVSFRCDEAIILMARQLVPDIRPRERAGDGTVQLVERERLLNEARENEFVISRVNAPLIGLCLAFWRQNRHARILNKDFGKGLASRIRKLAHRFETIPEMVIALDEQLQKEKARLLALAAQEEDVDLGRLLDEQACMLTIIKSCRTPEEAVKKANELFVEVALPRQIALATTHASKGDEREAVWVLADTYRQRETKEEQNLWYVAVTRAMKRLYLVADGTYNNGKRATDTWLSLPAEIA